LGIIKGSKIRIFKEISYTEISVNTVYGIGHPRWRRKFGFYSKAEEFINIAFERPRIRRKIHVPRMQ